MIVTPINYIEDQVATREKVTRDSIYVAGVIFDKGVMHIFFGCLHTALKDSS